MNSNLLSIVEIVIAVTLAGVILLQVRGSGTTLFGQAESSFRTRRGIERFLFRGTIVLAGLFAVIAVLTARYN
ncbi:MAG: preprotein translocase subunit SecG [Dehalococcoidia bacterium]|jgi:preprotein translocase subunit SecG|nr:preprotein translocase subunit SecG [Dehalococcoidia bacterium]